MATVIDAFVVSLGLDATQFKQGQQEAVSGFKKTQDQAVSAGKNIEASMKSATQMISQLRSQALMLFAAFTGGKGLKEFFEDFTKGNSALGRAAILTGSAVKEISRWQGMMQALGAPAEAATSNMASLSREMQNFALTGESAMIPFLRAMQEASGIDLSLIDKNGQLLSVTDHLEHLRLAAQALSDKGVSKPKIAAMLAGAGVGPEMINALLLTRKEFDQFIKDQEHWGTVTAHQAEVAKGFQRLWAGVGQSFETVGRIIMEKMEPQITKLLNYLIELADWAKAHPEEVANGFKIVAGAIGMIGVYLAIANPALLAFAAAGAGLTYVVTNWEDISAAIQKAGDNLQRFIEENTGLQSNPEVDPEKLKQQVADITNWISEHWKATLDDFNKRWTDTWSGLGGKILAVKDSIVGAVRSVFTDSFDWVITAYNKIATSTLGKAMGWAPINKDGSAPESNGQGGTTRGPLKSQSPQQSEADIQYYMSKGWTREQSAGIVANIVAESQGDHKVIGDNGQAYGLGQWHPDRQENFKKAFGHDIRELTRDEQLAFYDWELHNTEKSAGRALSMSRSASKSGEIVSRMFERPANTEGEAIARGTLATTLLAGPPSPANTQTAVAIAEASRRVPPASVLRGGAAAATYRNQTTSNDNSRSAETHIGTINIAAPAANDAHGVAGEMKDALDARFTAAQANTGQI